MRAFIAVELPTVFADEVAKISDSLSEILRGRFVSREALHMTLAFLDDIPDTEVERAREALTVACQGARPFDFVATGFGTFGRPINATLWLGIQEDPNLVALHDELLRELSKRGIAYDEKPFFPHVTLARHSRILKDALPRFELPQPERAVRVGLFKSEIDENGAMYHLLHDEELPLGRVC